MKPTLRQALAERRLLLDGAMGTMILKRNLTEQDFRGVAFAEHAVLLKGNNDVLSLTRPDVIGDIHRTYLEAGADIITTNTFSSQRISQAEYRLTDVIKDLNHAAATIAVAEAERMTELTPSQPRYVLGDVGPTSQMLSMGADIADASARAVTFDDLEAAFMEQIDALVAAGVDGILLETFFDTLNIKAAISAFMKVTENTDRDVPLLLSCTVSDKSGRLLSGQTIEAFVTSVAYARPLSVGMNCGLGAEAMIPLVRRMKAAVNSEGLFPEGCKPFISCHPNAGLPNQFGGYDDTPEDMVSQMHPLIDEDIARLIGGCCGTTPAHIQAMRALLDSAPVPVPEASSATVPEASSAPVPESSSATVPEVSSAPVSEASSATVPEAFPSVYESSPSVLTLSGQESFSFLPSDFVVVGERCNVAGSRKFLRLINEKKYEEALDIARTQIEKGAMVIDINMDDGLLDAKAEMRTFLNLIAADPSISRVPIMVDSSRFEVIEEGLKCCQGKCIVNSISLKQGEDEFLRQARIVKRLGAAVIVMCFDEQGQATDYDRRVAISQRAFRLLTEVVGFAPNDIIFDPNVLTIATGMAEHANYALDFIRATEWITTNLVGSRVSGGLSNLSFAFRGNNYLREAMHSVFLHHAKAAGMGMAIMNPGTAVRYDDIDPELRDALAAVILNTSDNATEYLMAHCPAPPSPKGGDAPKNAAAQTEPKVTVALGAAESLSQALLKGTTTNLESDILQLINDGKTPLDIISGPLMAGMTEVGRLFGEGKMFLPQVVKTARTMKKAVEILNPFMESSAAVDAVAVDAAPAGSRTILIATVKGDVHDIGKNIVGVVLACNGFKVIDLGEMVPAERIVDEAVKNNVDIVCLSGLITPSLDEMCTVAKAMQEADLTVPLFVGGATTSALHTAVKIAPLYDGGVFHLNDASQDPVLAMQLLDPSRREAVISENKERQQRIRLAHEQKQQQAERIMLSADKYNSAETDSQSADAIAPEYPSRLMPPAQEFVSVETLVPYIDWLYFYWAWRVKEDSDEGRLLRKDAEQMLADMAKNPDFGVNVLQVFYKARNVEGTGIEFVLNEGTCPCCNHTVTIPTPRQSAYRGDGTRRTAPLSLCDFVPAADGQVGTFACTVSQAFVERLEQLKAEHTDDYAMLLMHTLGDRLVEAAAERMSHLLEEQYQWRGIRPAIGYPSLPDQRAIFQLSRLLDFSSIGITLTENGAMYPQSSVCGLLISHPKARYFSVE